MNNETKRRIALIRKFIYKNYESFVKKYPDVVGVHIGKKVTDEKVKRNYSIVFHVVRKKAKKGKDKTIPKFFEIREKGKIIKIPTDVIESGRPKLSEVHPGDRVFHSRFPSSFGSASVFLTDSQDIFLLTNMHVIGKIHLRSSFELFDAPHDFGDAEIFCTAENDDTFDIACFKSGAIDDFLDAAIAIINPVFHDIIENTVDGTPISGFAGVDLSVAANPQKVIIRGATSGMIDGVAINSNTAIRAFTYPLGNRTIFDLLQISPCKTQGGDSGSPIIDPESNKLLGIVIGKDNKNTFTYGIAIKTILNFFQLKILNSGL